MQSTILKEDFPGFLFESNRGTKHSFKAETSLGKLINSILSTKLLCNFSYLEYSIRYTLFLSAYFTRFVVKFIMNLNQNIILIRSLKVGLHIFYLIFCLFHIQCVHPNRVHNHNKLIYTKGIVNSHSIYT